MAVHHEQKLHQDIEAVRMRLASSEEILSWSHGEVTKPETINYRTQKPEKDGLFSERIFGPVKDWECSCGKYKKVRYRGIVCDRCGVEVTRKEVRRERMGHIKLSSPCVHIWFLRSVPSRLGLLLDMSLPALERVVYYASWVVIATNNEAKKKALEKIRLSVRNGKTKKSRKPVAAERERLATSLKSAEEELSSLRPGTLLSETDFLRMERSYPGVAEIGIGAEAIARMLSRIDLAALKKELEEEVEGTSGPSRHKVMSRARVVRSLLAAKVGPQWMVLSALPVLPPDLRPMVALDGGRYASSDLNDLYRRVINRNNRLKRLLELKAPEVIVRNERRMLQEAVDALLDNSMRKASGVGMLGASRRPLRSLADILRGKSGRFRQNLLGKRVDYSGRSVIVVGPELKLSQCGVPKKMALELFKPFVMRKLIEKELAHNIRGASRLIEDASEVVWAALDEVIKDKLVLLNRAPTLHRLGIQSFRPKLIEGLAIQIHPLVCEAYNADFDGDQMAVHVPLSEEAQDEARELMHSLKNLWKPATGESIVGPFRDIGMGLFWLTAIRPGTKGEGKVFSSPEEAVLAERSGVVDIRAGIRLSNEYSSLFGETPSQSKGPAANNEIVERTTFVTSVGRLALRNALPKEVSPPNGQLTSGGLRILTQRIVEAIGDLEKVEEAFDALKELGFWAASHSGISWGMDDLVVPPEKTKLLEEAHARVRELERDVDKGLMTPGEKQARAIEIWSSLKTKVEEIARKSLNPFGPVLPVVSSGARGRWDQLIQVIGMKGLVANPKGEVIGLPILSSFVEGLNVLEYFISTHGARKGTADTALKTAAAGYLTRRLVEAGQEVVVSEEDCGDDKGLEISKKRSEELGVPFWFRLFGRTVAATLKDRGSGQRVLARKGELLGRERAQELAASDLEAISVRSPLTCRVLQGVCRACYGLDMGRMETVNLGTAVGIIAAQSIGEPGTQLTMRTFHIGGVAGGGDITTGLPRVEELFEARAPKNAALLSPADGEILSVEKVDGGTRIVLAKEKSRNKKSGTQEILLEPGILPLVKAGDKVRAGDPLSPGPVNPKELFRYAGREKTARSLIDEVLRAYASQGVSIHDKHIEMIVRQMFSRVWVIEPNDSRFLPEAIVTRKEFELERERLSRLKSVRQPKGEELLLGITRVALTTPSVLAAASFQETTRVLVAASLEGREDKLEGLKENIIIGRLIPAGTGFHPSS